MKAFSKIVEWIIILFFLFTQLTVVGSLYCCALIVTKWQNEHRPGALLPIITEWCFRSGFVTYIAVSCCLFVSIVVCKIFEKNVPLGYILVPLGILLIFLSIYIFALGSVTVNWGGLIDYYNWK